MADIAAYLTQLDQIIAGLDSVGASSGPVTTADVNSAMQGRMLPERGMRRVTQKRMAGVPLSNDEMASVVAHESRQRDISDTAARGGIQGLAELTGVPSIVRGAANVQQGLSEGQPLQAAAGVGEATLGALPGLGLTRAGAPVIQALMGSAPRAMATFGGAGGAMAAGEADAQARLTRQQQRELEVERQRAQTQAEAAQQAQQRELEAERVRKEQAVEEERKKQLLAMELDKARKEAEVAQSARPIREQYPWLGPAAQAGGFALAAGLPFALRGASRLGSYSSRSDASRMDDAISTMTDTVSRFASRPSAASRSQLRSGADELTNLLDKVEPTRGKKIIDAIVGPAAGGVLAYEGRALPDQLDLSNPKLSQELRDQAKSNIGNVSDGALQVILGALLGGSAQKAANLLPKKEPNTARAKALRDEADRLVKRRRD